ncbi:MAG: hypothetical protein WBA74_19500, partial [Cyclobacteriaceae bacterium]
EKVSKPHRKRQKISTRESIFSGIQKVLTHGEEKEILYMLGKLRELNDPRLAEPVQALLQHPSDQVKIAVIRNLYFLDPSTIAIDVKPLLNSENTAFARPVLEYLLQHAEKNEDIVFDKYLDDPRERIAKAALLCLAEEARDNRRLGEKYNLTGRVEKCIDALETMSVAESIAERTKLIEVVGLMGYQRYYYLIDSAIRSDDKRLKEVAISAAGNTMSEQFVGVLLELLPDQYFREMVVKALLQYDRLMINLLEHKAIDPEVAIKIRMWFPKVIAGFNSQEAVNSLMRLFSTLSELQMRLECLKELVQLKKLNERLIFDRNKIARLILEECRLYDQTIYAMHTQIIVQYLNKKKFKRIVSESESEARDSLMELLERRLEASLERIFKLLELRYYAKDIEYAYKGILSDEDERRTNAIEFLDILLNKNLKEALIPIVEATILDTTSEEFIDRINHNRYTEFECFELLLNGRDQKLKLAVLYLIGHQTEVSYRRLVAPLVHDRDKKIRDFADKALIHLQERAIK